jgi:hypothetical protein
VAMPSKGSRLITVDGRPYRWRVRKRPTYSQGIAQSPLSFAVEAAHGRGAVLVVTAPVAHPGNWMGDLSGAVTPAVVAVMVLQARSDGWRADQAGPAHHISVAPDTWMRLTTP